MWTKKFMIINLVIGQIKIIALYKMSYYPDSKNKIKVELILSNSAAKFELKK